MFSRLLSTARQLLRGVKIGSAKDGIRAIVVLDEVWVLDDLDPLLQVIDRVRLVELD